MTSAIALFLKAPRPGSVKTRLAADIGSAHAAGLYRELAERTIAEVERLGWPATIWYAPADAAAEMREWLGEGWRFRPQPDGDLGERLWHAVRSCDDAETQLLIGGDCPGLGAEVLEAAREALEAAGVVIGPSTDGGYYLLGARHPFPDLFSAMPWSTSALLGRTRERLRSLGLAWRELPTLRDVDTMDDVLALGLLS